LGDHAFLGFFRELVIVMLMLFKESHSVVVAC
jgi:hypothetical protein